MRASEHGAVERVFTAPEHPYTRALLASTPSVEKKRERMVLTGELPSPLDPPAGCAFHTRCPFARERCQAERPVLRKLGDRAVACHFAEEFS